MILRPLYCDQLSPKLPSLRGASPKDDLIFMAETKDEATYIKHHKKKLIFQFSAMRHFAEELKEEGFQVCYVPLDDSRNQGTFCAELLRAIREYSIQEIILTKPGEYRQLQDILKLQDTCGISIKILEDDRFFIEIEQFIEWKKEHKHLLMENFYRMMRKRTSLLMEGGKPVEGTWNLDKQNRKTLPRDVSNPTPIEFEPDNITNDVVELVKKNFSDHFGDAEAFRFAVTATDAKRALDYFIEHHLAYFGDYQDTMKEGQPFLFHSVISPYLNAGLLDPRSVCEQVEEAYRKGQAPLNAAEGFIRQILGWREFVRGVYWSLMPSYVENNVMNCQRPLPEFYWTGETQMNCVHQVVKMTKEDAYSHHIQRLMVTGNFALLAGCRPQEVHEWYLAVYADAYEWVELPNTLGMALHADGGIVGTKPYISSGAYINRMSDYCKNCCYDVKEKVGDNACPFNSLYWYFIRKHASRFQNNPRMKLPYRNLDKMDKEYVDQMIEHAEEFLDSLE